MRTPAWLAHTAEIRDRVHAISSPLLDRAAIEELFSLRKRQAANLMRKMDGCVLGGAHAVRRETLLEFLDAQGKTRCGGADPRERKHALALALREDRTAPPPLRAILRPKLPRNEYSQLPSGTHLTGAGRLEISFNSPGDILGAIVRLAQLADCDPEGFARSLEYRPPEGEER